MCLYGHCHVMDKIWKGMEIIPFQPASTGLIFANHTHTHTGTHRQTHTHTLEEEGTPPNVGLCRN